MTESTYRLRPVTTGFRARQWRPGTDPGELAQWCEGHVYSGTAHGHTRPTPFAEHTCVTPGETVDGSKGHVDPGDWIVRLGADPGGGGWGVYEVLSPDEFAAKYEPWT